MSFYSTRRTCFGDQALGLPARAVVRAIVLDMTAAEAWKPAPEVDKTASAIRAALLPEEREAFDEACRAAVTQAVGESSVSPLVEVLDHWHRIARATVQNPEAHRRMLERFAEFERTGTVAARPGDRRGTWDELRAELGW